MSTKGETRKNQTVWTGERSHAEGVNLKKKETQTEHGFGVWKTIVLQKDRTTGTNGNGVRRGLHDKKREAILPKNAQPGVKKRSSLQKQNPR